jgi:hypothetical protein
MADSGALRVRRARAHAAGDHSLCRRCPAVRGGTEPSKRVALVPRPPAPLKLDAEAEMRALASRLAAAHEAEPSNALLARELRMTLRELIAREGHDSGFDDLAAEYGSA